jgi:hypothetical protein
MNGTLFYPHLIKITRPTTAGNLGAAPYSGETPANEAVVAEKIPAAIQLGSGAGKPEGKLPGDAPRTTYWRVLIPSNAIPAGSVRNRDIVTDEAGLRYQVTAAYMTILGYKLVVERLET